MTTVLDVDGTTFTFGPGWLAEQYDSWTFYRNQLSKLDSKGVDIVAVHADTLHLIEVKDYTHPETETIPIEKLPQTVAAKCRDTLGGLAAGRVNAVDSERAFSSTALTATKISVVLHIELPGNKGGALSNPAAIRINLQSKLRSVVKAIDPHARVEDHNATHGSWSARRTVATAP